MRRRLAKLRQEERGSVSLLVLAAALGIMIIAGLVIDGGAVIRGKQEAERVAAEAGRRAGQEIDQNLAMRQGVVRTDDSQARAVAAAYLRRAGYGGSVDIHHDGTRITVTVTDTVQTTFLKALGINRLNVDGDATVVMQTRNTA